ncbi:aminotransferase class I/II-fold pyridoxal phosphate-dependent enzyme [Halosimplex amylolyticum]|uniref:aminotransferase class I/II-fold pyridoxal phosphate-dependent enzyme n=1 Tax=Halosimplex amylolyticum TaxID=3396616 RepID=UPI003F543FBC
MDIEPFALERWLAEHEHEAPVNLGDSGVRPLEAARFDTDPGRLGYVIPTNGDPDLRASVADRYDRGADELLFTCGTQEANLLAVLATLERDSHAVCVTPTYQSLHSLPAAVAEVTRVELAAPEWRLDPDDVAEAIRSDTDLVVLNNPNNPTGRIHPQETVDAVYDLAAAADAYLLSDEVYRPLAESDERVEPVASMGPHGLSTCGLSKGWGLPGLRFGWLAGPEEVVTAAWEWKDYTTISPSAFGQHVGRQAIEREDELLAENRAHVRRNRDLLDAFVDEYGLDWHLPAGATGFLTVPEAFESSEDFCRALADEGVVVAPGETFDRPEYVRVGFGADRATLSDGLDRMGRVVEDRRSG